MFTKLETKDMEEICNGIFKKLNRMSKELKVRSTQTNNVYIIIANRNFT